MFEGTLELNSPLSKEDWDILTDVELEKTEHIWFTTPNKKRVDYIKADVLDGIRDEIERLTITEGGDDYVRKIAELFSLKVKVLQIIDKYKAESKCIITDTDGGEHLVEYALIDDIKKLPTDKQIEAIKCLLSKDGWQAYMWWLVSKVIESEE